MNDIKWIWLVLLLSISVQALGHDSNLAYYQLNLDTASGSLRMLLPSSGVECMMKKAHPEINTQEMSSADMETLLVTYLKSHISLRINHKPLRLSAGIIKLGGHETDLRLLIQGVPKRIEMLDVYIDAFAENEHQVNNFHINYQSNSSRSLLTRANGFHSQFQIGATGINMLEAQEASFAKYGTLGWAIFIGLVLAASARFYRSAE